MSVITATSRGGSTLTPAPAPGATVDSLHSSFERTALEGIDLRSQRLGLRRSSTTDLRETVYALDLYRDRLAQLNDATPPPDTLVQPGSHQALVASVSQSWRQLDNPVFPRKGRMVSVQAGVAIKGLLTDQSFVRLDGQLREYLTVLRTALHDGKVDIAGEFYTAHAAFQNPPGTPVLISALREHAFELAGELSDGGISWITPANYLTSVSKPAMERGAKRANRPVPPLIAHVFVSASEHREQVRGAVRASLKYYAEAPFYQKMFAASGFPLGANNAIPDGLLDAITVSGSRSEIAESLQSRLESGIDELLIDVVPGDDQTAEEDAVFEMVRSL